MNKTVTILTILCVAIFTISWQQSNYLKEDLLGKIDPTKHADFTHIDPKYADKSNIYLRKAAYNSFLKMRAAAENDGIRLTIRSATRSFDYQKMIWEKKWNGEMLVEGKNLQEKRVPPVKRAKMILRYSSMPGTSRHHWGTEIDLNSFSNSYFESGQGKKEFDWLTANAATYGFYRPYTVKGENRPYGYEEEKWHWSYKPIADEILKQYNQKITYADITGFKGSKHAEKVKAIEYYVNGIAK